MNDSQRRRPRHGAVGQDDRRCRSTGPSTQDGEYRGTLRPRRGRALRRAAWRPRATGRRRSARATIHVRASAGDAEYFDAAMRAPLLKRIADETGGRFFTPANAASLPDAISYSGRGVTVVEERELWDMPVVLLLHRRPDGRRVGLPARAGAGMRRRRGSSAPSRWRRGSVRSRAPAAAQDTHLLVVTGVERRRGARGRSSRSGRRRSSTRRRTRTASPTPTSRTWRTARPGSVARPGTLDARGRREGLRRPRRARQAGRRGRDRAAIGHGSFDGRQAAFNLPGPDLTRRPTTRRSLAKLSAAARRVREHEQLERRVPAAAGRARAASSSRRPRPAASATRRASPSTSSRRSATEAADRNRNGHVSVAEAFEYAKTKVGEGVPAGRAAPDRARDARRRRATASWRRRCSLGLGARAGGGRGRTSRIRR